MIAAILLLAAAAPASPSPESFLVDPATIDEVRFDADMQALCYRDADCLGKNRAARDWMIAAYHNGTEKQRAKIVKAVSENISGNVVNWRWVPMQAGMDPSTKPPKITMSMLLDMMIAADQHVRATTIDCTTKVSKGGTKYRTRCR